MLGRVQSAGGTPAPFRKLLVDDIAPVAQVINCAPLDYDVRAADSFAELSTTLATDGSGRMIDTVFQPGTRKQACSSRSVATARGASPRSAGC
jgi:hypothetical protein